MGDHWMNRPIRGGRQMDLSESTMQEVDRAGSHPGELVVPGFPIGSYVTHRPIPGHTAGGGRDEVIGYYRGNLVLRNPDNGTTHHIDPRNAEVIS